MTNNAMDEYLSREEIVTKEDIHLLLIHFVKTNHRVKNADIKGETIMERCNLLYSTDYQCTLVPNLNGELCSHYPMKLIIPEYEKDPTSNSHVESRHSQIVLYQMIKNARCARCRTRFVVPAILFQGKYICRSATLSGGAEMFGRSTTDYLLSNENPPFLPGATENGKVDMYDKYRGHDIQLLKYFDVEHICDLMVEKKKTKFGMPVTSSEKVDKEGRYSKFTILGMPFPGCEFFKDWKESDYFGDRLMYDWRQALNNSALELPPNSLVTELAIDWSKYKDWSLTKLTQNYLKLLLKYIDKSSSGILVHCISGWDRTPLFVSLIRISLWADGLIHQSLNATELLYLTLGYDWYLFGHDLPDRISNGEEVMLFCFKVLKDIASEEYSLAPSPGSAVVRANESQPPRVTGTQLRVDSDSSFGIQGVLLDDALMNLSCKGSTGSLNSLASSDNINFTIGIPEEQEEEVSGCARGEDELAALGRTGSTSSFRQKRRSMSPTARSNSPATRVSPNIQHSSPVNVGRIRRKSSDGQILSMHSNHYTASPGVRASSPVVVPQRSEDGSTHMPCSSHTQSIGSWQIIPSMEGLRMETNNSHSSTERSNSSQEADIINLKNSIRWQRLDAISDLFENIYFTVCPSHARSSSVGAGLSSLFDRIADSIVGLRGNGGPPAGNPRREV